MRKIESRASFFYADRGVEGKTGTKEIIKPTQRSRSSPVHRRQDRSSHRRGLLLCVSQIGGDDGLDGELFDTGGSSWVLSPLGGWEPGHE